MSVTAAGSRRLSESNSTGAAGAGIDVVWQVIVNETEDATVVTVAVKTNSDEGKGPEGSTVNEVVTLVIPYTYPPTPAPTPPFIGEIDNGPSRAGWESLYAALISISGLILIIMACNCVGCCERRISQVRPGGAVAGVGENQLRGEALAPSSNVKNTLESLQYISVDDGKSFRL